MLLAGHIVRPVQQYSLGQEQIAYQPRIEERLIFVVFLGSSRFEK
jgi:hypothetical protein